MWMRLDEVPADAFVAEVATPMLHALAAHGVHANLAPTRNIEIDGRTDLAYALYPAGELSFIYTTGPTTNAITGQLDDFRHMLATIEAIPDGVGLTEAAVTRALADFESGIRRRGRLSGDPDTTVGCSLGRPMPGHPAVNTDRGCYIATAVYGDHDAPQVRVLRRFRDETLSASAPGRAACRIYYNLSPPLARRMAGLSAAIVRAGLDALVAALRRAERAEAVRSGGRD